MTDLPGVFEFSTDISDAKPPEPLPVGEYRATVRSAEIGLSKSSGNPMMTLAYVIDAAQYPADYTDGNPDGTTLMNYKSLADTISNRYLTKLFCEMHGVVPGKRINANEFIGQDVMVSISHEAFNGLMQARLRPERSA